MGAFDLRKSEERALARLGVPSSGELTAEDRGTPPRAVPRLLVRNLPQEVQDALYNFAADSKGRLSVPEDQLAFYCFNYGHPRALSFAAGLPVTSLKLALQRPGWRPKSRALVGAILHYRGGE